MRKLITDTGHYDRAAIMRAAHRLARMPQPVETRRTWAQCMETGDWPGYVNDVVVVNAPGYVEHEIEDSIMASGERIV